MTDLSAMTKADLLALAAEQGVEADDSMLKADIIAALEAAGQPGELVTTTKTKDYLNRALTNTIPGTSNATDYLGRAVAVSDRDYLGRALA